MTPMIEINMFNEMLVNARNEAGVWQQLHELLLAELRAGDVLDLSRASVDGSHLRALKGGDHTGRSPVDRGKTGSKHHVIVDADGIPLAATVTGGNRNDVTRAVLRRPATAAPISHTTAISDYTVRPTCEPLPGEEAPLDSPPIEWRILTVLLQQSGQGVTARHLLQSLRDPGREDRAGYLRVYLIGLRRTFEPVPGRGFVCAMSVSPG
ncbi:hypothetical protein ABH941_007900 [Streptacidiphilus sp. EB103A]